MLKDYSVGNWIQSLKNTLQKLPSLTKMVIQAEILLMKQWADFENNITVHGP